MKLLKFTNKTWSTSGAFVLLAIVLGVLFWQSFQPGIVHFSNDGPLGMQKSAWIQLPQLMFGGWCDLNSIGVNTGGTSPTISTFIRWMLGPVGYSKFIAPITLWILGVSAWICFRRLGLSPLACLLGALGASLNSGWFSTACWGVAPQIVTFAMNFLAVALVVSNTPATPWWLKGVRLALAGLAVGMGVMEGADIGAIFSMFTAAFIIFHSLHSDGKSLIGLVRGLGRVIVVAVMAGVIAAHTVFSLVSTQIRGVAVAKQDAESRAQRWDWATQWSLPKREVLGLIVPGLFGFRMDTPDGGNYWGAMGRDPAWDRYFAGGPLVAGTVVRVTFQGASELDTTQAVRPDGKLTLPLIGEVSAGGKSLKALEEELAELYSSRLPGRQVTVAMQSPPGFIRYSGGGNYMGVALTLVAVWAMAQALQRQRSVFSESNRRFLWFWMVVLILSLLLAFGRFAPFYQFVYALPYFSTIRNPAKFMHIFTWAMVIIFAFGVHGLSRCYMETPSPASEPLGVRFRNWWARVRGFDRRWTIGCGLVFGVSLLAWLIYASMQPSLAAHIQTVHFDEKTASQIAAFSIRQVGWFVLFLALSAGLVTLVMSGAFAGARAVWGGFCLGALLVVDLGWMDRYWTVFWDYHRKYETNPVIDLLRDKPYEHRVAILPFRFPRELSLFEQLYRVEWAQHHFPYYDIQSLDIVQMPRMPEDLAAFEGALAFRGTAEDIYLVSRRWQLTNTRYLLGPAGFIEALNEQIDPGKRRFRFATRFDVVLKPGVEQASQFSDLTAVINANGNYALFEFTGALPRAGLYSAWQVSTNDAETLRTLAARDFDPEKTVLVATPLPPQPETATNQSPGIVEFVSYAPKRIEFKARVETPAVMLLNDKYDPAWQVWVDGKQEQLLRCNFIMRGVYLSPGEHHIEFAFRPPVHVLYVSLAGIVIGLVLVCCLAVFGRNHAQQTASAGEGKPKVRPQPVAGSSAEKGAASDRQEKGNP